MVNFVDCEQGSPEWLSLRRRHVCATDIGKIMGLSPWGTAHDVFMDKRGEGKPFISNPATIFGTRMEPEIREFYERQVGEWYPAAVVVNSDRWALSSLDGINSSHTRILEIKTCGLKTFQDAINGKISPHYMSQAQWALMCVPSATEVEFVFYHSENYAHVVIGRDEELIDKMREIGKAFYDESIIGGIAPELTEKDSVDMSGDKDWMSIAERLCDLQPQLKLLEKEIKGLKTQLIELTDDGNCNGGGVSLTRSWRAGQIDFAKMISDGLDIEKYRKSQTSSITITINSKKDI
jgi:putative phage-type endonuclease